MTSSKIPARILNRLIFKMKKVNDTFEHGEIGMPSEMESYFSTKDGFLNLLNLIGVSIDIENVLCTAHGSECNECVCGCIMLKLCEIVHHFQKKPKMYRVTIPGIHTQIPGEYTKEELVDLLPKITFKVEEV